MQPLEIFPREQVILARDQQGNLVDTVRDGRVVQWDITDNISKALTAVEARQNSHRVPNHRKHGYLRQLYDGAFWLDADKIRKAVEKYPECVVQPDEILTLPDSHLKAAAEQICFAIWEV